MAVEMGDAAHTLQWKEKSKCIRLTQSENRAQKVLGASKDMLVARAKQKKKEATRASSLLFWHLERLPSVPQAHFFSKVSIGQKYHSSPSFQ